MVDDAAHRHPDAAGRGRHGRHSAIQRFPVQEMLLDQSLQTGLLGRSAPSSRCWCWWAPPLGGLFLASDLGLFFPSPSCPARRRPCHR
ncbi:hypothetical protein DSL92_05930 [Billgrantia gudaonensis]|uniref:Uncharacterized protein n=1 Tax=Billgrantia gudaonensis TaxID=376427 RepID=A0A432JIV4_9GAMM|nr:hypothetical protein DSL92_05930 [Halomonas gudaonensis]